MRRQWTDDQRQAVARQWPGAARRGAVPLLAGVLTHLRVEPTKRGGGEHRRIQLDLAQPIFHHDLQWLHPRSFRARAIVDGA
jgi:hypothetical protein